jgi:hypothetical protein
VDANQACPDALIAFFDTEVGSAEEQAAAEHLLDVCNVIL